MFDVIWASNASGTVDLPVSKVRHGNPLVGWVTNPETIVSCCITAGSTSADTPSIDGSGGRQRREASELDVGIGVPDLVLLREAGVLVAGDLLDQIHVQRRLPLTTASRAPTRSGA
jgi:hypothetical protein